jgi:acyl-coenzyme A synthetase/AMP-(fatty) acid ligase
MRRFGVTVLVLVAIAAPLFADSGTTRLENRFKEYFNNLLVKVEQTKDPAEKRALLNESLERFLTATDQVRKLPFVNQEQREALARFDAVVQEKHDELTGAAGFAMVANADLDDFAHYMVQDLEQAATYYLALSGIAIVLIIVLLIILL